MIIIISSFCQMCQKQCRDANGFKCHLTSEAHQRQLLLFAENSNSYLRQFSNDFEKNFMQLLRTSYGTKRVRANEVYNAFIKDKVREISRKLEEIAGKTPKNALKSAKNH